ncbi:MAG: membrane protein insertion efficiency factor YidD [Clostridia bacterium]|nr:membrane protein insertion efficiency factor YidD [Clostridia bacterium]
MRHIAIFLVKLYRRFISPLKPPCCRFTPTCSQYAIEAFAEWGFICGLGLSVWRILRCNPFCRGGYDPVPECPWHRKADKSKDKGENNL